MNEVSAMTCTSTNGLIDNPAWAIKCRWWSCSWWSYTNRQRTWTKNPRKRGSWIGTGIWMGWHGGWATWNRTNTGSWDGTGRNIWR